MSVVFSTAVLGLAWFAAVNVVASVVAWTLTVVLVREHVAADGRRARRLLSLRLLPAVAAIIVSGVLFAPAHWRLEPRDLNERFGVLAYALAGLGLVLIARSVARAWSVFRAGWRLRSLSITSASAVHRSGLDSTQAYEMTSLAGISLAGVLHPRVLIGRTARTALTPAELDVAVAHELAHRHAWDNLKRCAMFCAPDMLASTRTARRLETQWRAEAECLADASAAGGDPLRAALLASALVKVARLSGVSDATPRIPVWSTFHEPGLLESRVRRLICGAMPSRPRPARLGIVWTLVAGAAAAAWVLDAPIQLHYATELLVRILP
jgi:hypothetical protein